MRKMSDCDILKIPDWIIKGWTQRRIAKELGCSATTIRRIISGRLYKHLHRILQERLEEASNWRTCTKCAKTFPKTEKFFQKLNTRKIGFEARCLTCKRGQNKDRLDNLKLAALQHYSKTINPSCECCKENIAEFLTIDHVNGDGASHRKIIRGKFSTIGQWLKRVNYPPGFRVLCMNCNISLGLFGYCPHQKCGG